MNFDLTDEQRMLQETLQRFLHEKYSHEARRKTLESGATYNPALFAEMAELGVLSALFAEDDGGFGGSGFDVSLVFEELGRAGVIEPILGSAVLAGSLLAEAGNNSLLLQGIYETGQTHRSVPTSDTCRGEPMCSPGFCEALLEKVITGRSILCFAHSEPDARYELNQVASCAESRDGRIILNGTKTHVINGAQADMMVVSAREAGNVADESGISLFLLPLNTPGVSCQGHQNIDGTAGATITLQNVLLDDSCRLGKTGDGSAAIEQAVARAILAICAEAVGAMEAAKQLTADYLRERQQFGMSLGKFQALQHRMADMLIEIEQARSAVVNLAGNLDQPRDIRERYVSAAKNLVGRVGTLVAEECIQLHGGMGMTDEYALAHFARRLVMMDHQFGDVDYHLERFIALSAVETETGRQQ